MLKKKKIKLGRKPKAEELKLKYRIGLNLSESDYNDLLDFKRVARIDEDADAVRKLFRQGFDVFKKAMDKPSKP